jgi:dissimilatory sulfite reductase (desulfoviridin) alpha/beta subunit
MAVFAVRDGSAPGQLKILYTKLSSDIVLSRRRGIEMQAIKNVLGETMNGYWHALNALHGQSLGFEVRERKQLLEALLACSGEELESIIDTLDLATETLQKLQNKLQDVLEKAPEYPAQQC